MWFAVSSSSVKNLKNKNMLVCVIAPVCFANVRKQNFQINIINLYGATYYLPLFGPQQKLMEVLVPHRHANNAHGFWIIHQQMFIQWSRDDVVKNTFSGAE